MEKALAQAKKDGRLFILGKMVAVQPTPNPKISKYNSQNFRRQIDPEKSVVLSGQEEKLSARSLPETRLRLISKMMA